MIYRVGSGQRGPARVAAVARPLPVMQREIGEGARTLRGSP
jgi:hypothetical protein